MSDLLGRLNPRELRLVAVTLSVIAVGAVFLGGRAAISRLRELNSRVENRELEIESLKEQYVQGDAINAAYASVVKEHSSALTVAQIHDHLRREIYRLTTVDLPPTPEKPSRQMALVKIPILQEGQITQGSGHREYQVQFQIPGARLDFLLAFLERIEDSEQLLRIDNIEIGRDHNSTGVHATLTITRTVLDNPEAAASVPDDASPDEAAGV